MITLEDNYSTMFLAALLKVNNPWFKKELFSVTNKNEGHRRLVNAYLYQEGLNSFNEDCLSLVIHNYQSPDFEEEENKFLVHPDLIEYYDIADTKYAVLVFNMTRYSDYYLFLEGKYSKFSDWAKQLIIEKPICRPEGAITAKAILDKSDQLRKHLAKHFEVAEDSFDELGSIWSQCSQSNILTKDIMLELENSGKIKIKPEV